MRLDEMRRMIFKDLQYLNKEKVLIKCMTELDKVCEPVKKNIVLHEQRRRAANDLFSKYQDNNLALNHRTLLLYNESLSLAPNQSEALAITHGNKSALLLRMCKYKESIDEIDRAMKITQSLLLKVKLLCRKAECLTALKLPDNRSCLEKARFYISQIEDSENIKKVLVNLVETTQSGIDSSEVDEPRVNNRRMQASGVLAKVENNSIWDAVSIEYSEMYGQHLVAARDFQAGEVVLVEDPYRNQLDDTKNFQYCYTCFSYLWTAVPCDTCCVHLFCSEQCKKKAVVQYHGMECRVIVRLCHALRTEMSNGIALLVTIFCKAYKEAGSVVQMQNVIESLDRSEGQQGGFIPLNQMIPDYRNVYALRLRKFAKAELEESIRNACIALMGLAKYTNIFGKTYGFDEVKKLMKNDAAIFVGAFLLKMNLVTISRLTTTQLPDPTMRFKDSKPPQPLGTDLIVNPIVSMTIFGCVPNITTCIASGVKLVTYALQPIKAGTKLCMLWSGAIYAGASKLERQERHFKMYNCPCMCQACTEDWSDTLVDSTKLAAVDTLESGTRIAKEIRDEIDALSAEYAANSHKPNQPDIKLVCKTQNLVRRIWKHFPLPSPVVLRAVSLMTSVYDAFYIP